MHFMRALYRLVQGLETVGRLTVAGLHAVVTHRRDTALEGAVSNKYRPVVLTDQQITDLRTAPFLGEKYLFPQSVVERIKSERDEAELKNMGPQALSKLASTMDRVIQVARPQQQRAPKRKSTPSATQSVPPERVAAKRSKMKLHRDSSQASGQSQRGQDTQPSVQSPSGQAQPQQHNR